MWYHRLLPRRVRLFLLERELQKMDANFPLEEAGGVVWVDEEEELLEGAPEQRGSDENVQWN